VSNNGILYIVPTPIGNLQDITYRAVEILTQVNLIACEDTRHSQKLLQHLGISTRLISYHEHNEQHRTEKLIEGLKQGQQIALISDAGTPLISDPGYDLVNQCRRQQIQVIPLPGACAAITALSGAGLGTNRFIFEGFLPVKEQALNGALANLLEREFTSIFYESPRRVKHTVEQCLAVLGAERHMVLAKEITKTFEIFVSGNAEHILSWLTQDAAHQKGEFVLMIAGIKRDSDAMPVEAMQLLKTLMKELPLKKAAAVTAAHYGLKKNQLYQIGLELDD
jgi:16S rRNA (cytidine1402-2'-O)-methyltransferase